MHHRAHPFWSFQALSRTGQCVPSLQDDDDLVQRDQLEGVPLGLERLSPAGDLVACFAESVARPASQSIECADVHVESVLNRLLGVPGCRFAAVQY